MGAAALPIMAIGGIVQAGSSLFSGIAQSNALEAQAEFQARQMEMNSQIANVKADEAISRGDREAKDVLRMGEKIKGQQRAGYAGQGVKVDSGSADYVQQETDMFSKLDAETVKNNAWREAWGYKVEALNNTQTAQFTRQAGRNASRNTLIASGLNAGGSLIKTYGDYYKATT
jgi:hypothetical protein